MVASQTETYVVSNIGTCLLLKLCGFVEEQRAEIRDVGENHLQLRLGSSWLGRLLGSGDSGHPLQMDIQFDPDVESASSPRPQARVQIVVRDGRILGQSDRFEAAARRILWQLRGHLMVQSYGSGCHSMNG